MIWSVTHREVYPSASASWAKSLIVFPVAYSHLCGSITPNCIPSSSRPLPCIVADMTLHHDDGGRSSNSLMPPEDLFQQRAARTVPLSRRSLLAAEYPRRPHATGLAIPAGSAEMGLNTDCLVRRSPSLSRCQVD